ncbi:sensor domain-containing phosphodiesterase [Aquipuribacter nitratireducens]|uniref:EAL domain-containing protein n=1 Tax=Aquipuribacter nitratireducens TaxID=650104 RepID=A0ABW0GKY0_9MICO
MSRRQALVPLHPAESARVAGVRATRAVVGAEDTVLDALTSLAARTTGAGGAMVTLVDESTVRVVAATGTGREPLQREDAMCAWAVAHDAPLHLADLTCDERFADGPVVAAGVRSYHGIPLHGPGGLPLGALCVVDAGVLQLSDDLRDALGELATVAESHLVRLHADLPGTPAVVPARPAPAAEPAADGRTHDLAGVLDVADGLASGQFVPYYQPIVSLDDGALVGVEALVRWEHPDLGLLPPAAFLPQAEADHVVLALDALVLEEACSQVAHWRRTRPDAADLELSVNVSGHHLARGCLAELVADALDRSGLPAGALTLELTETVLLQSGDEWTLAQLDELRALGVGLALDDFGTAYSTLSYLQSFPVTRLKIDRSFVRGLGVDRRDALLVESVVGLARGLGLDVVGEGVETPRQAGVLRGLGCDKAQGYHFQRPVGAEQLEGSGRLGPVLDGGAVAPIDFGDDAPALPSLFGEAAGPFLGSREAAAC